MYYTDNKITKISEETWVSGSKNAQFKNSDISFRDRHDEGPDGLEVDGLDTYNPTGSPTTSLPSVSPSISPSKQPSVSVSPSHTPSISPTGSIVPSISPSNTPSILPSVWPTNIPSGYPSMAPSMHPSMAPSMHPSTTPSIYPSTKPSHLPSILASSTPSTYPSRIPSLSPTSLPSTKPSNLPSLFPSLKPSLSNSPSSFPTTQPSLLPSLSPSLPECFVDETGFYGNKGGNSTEVNFYYQVRLMPNTTSTELEDDILNSLENAISKKILPGLFQDTCGKFRRHRMMERSLLYDKINGVSAQPLDSVFDDLLCRDSIFDCFVIDGRMTIYTGEMNSTETSNFVKDKIRDSMQSGELNEGVDKRITSVEYLDDITTLPNNGIIVGTKNDGDNNGIGRIPLWSMAAAFGILLLIGGYMLQKKRRKNSEELDEKEIVTNFDYNDADIDMEDIEL